MAKLVATVDVRELPTRGQSEIFAADFRRLSRELERLGAVLYYPDGSPYVDPARVPDGLADTYCAMVSYGYANGYL